MKIKECIFKSDIPSEEPVQTMGQLDHHDPLNHTKQITSAKIKKRATRIHLKNS
jgi:hypothetical protein